MMRRFDLPKERVLSVKQVERMKRFDDLFAAVNGCAAGSPGNPLAIRKMLELARTPEEMQLVRLHILPFSKLDKRFEAKRWEVGRRAVADLSNLSACWSAAPYIQPGSAAEKNFFAKWDGFIRVLLSAAREQRSLPLAQKAQLNARRGSGLEKEIAAALADLSGSKKKRKSVRRLPIGGARG